MPATQIFHAFASISFELKVPACTVFPRIRVKLGPNCNLIHGKLRSSLSETSLLETV